MFIKYLYVTDNFKTFYKICDKITNLIKFHIIDYTFCLKLKIFREIITV